MAGGLPPAAMCVRGVDDLCVLQFTLINAAGCALHRRTSRVIHRIELCFCFVQKGREPGQRPTRPPRSHHRGGHAPWQLSHGPSATTATTTRQRLAGERRSHHETLSRDTVNVCGHSSHPQVKVMNRIKKVCDPKPRSTGFVWGGWFEHPYTPAARR